MDLRGKNYTSVNAPGEASLRLGIWVRELYRPSTVAGGEAVLTSNFQSLTMLFTQRLASYVHFIFIKSAHFLHWNYHYGYVLCYQNCIGDQWFTLNRAHHNASGFAHAHMSSREVLVTKIRCVADLGLEVFFVRHFWLRVRWLASEVCAGDEAQLLEGPWGRIGESEFEVLNIGNWRKMAQKLPIRFQEHLQVLLELWGALSCKWEWPDFIPMTLLSWDTLRTT